MTSSARPLVAPGGRSSGGRGARLAAALAAALVAGAAAAKGGVYRESAHGRRDSGVLRLAGYQRGECIHCHGGGRRAGSGAPARAAASTLSDNAGCYACHGSSVGRFFGETQYAASLHGRSPAVVWPGPTPPARQSTDAGKCVNCHDPHGVRDAIGLVPSLLKLRGALQCLGCHAGNPGADVATSLASAFRHPLVDLAEAPTVAGGSAAPPAAGGTCGGCHNVHAATLDAVRTADGIPRALPGARRVRITNGRPGTPPTVTLLPVHDPTPPREFEVCFKCHTSGAPGRTRGQDVAVAFNPSNPSFHPVEDAPRISRIDPRSFVMAWRDRKLVTCSDCHGSDDPGVRGPHGSRNARILRKRHLPPSSRDAPLASDLCFGCHDFATYADPFGRSGSAASRYAGHLPHATAGVPCSACHEAHGSATLPSLLALRTPGLITFTQDAAGGSCTVSCHRSSPALASYRLTYPR